ncbi:tRNA lysidine(34) synthetase TilS [Halalkalibacter krulwichiae]|uniref:tRNA(Ile)-lysidine synthase n=1 Tax=Halalkalibacter krulwichiae TaxID=199441 RepID=A0A1X9MDD8_9BACI|nr:tRNA lysidine(34) synthetase TilS [Halalkalibacter krulwichiae]ARK28462.1 tRNA(Ile)-lysidine synthase [Halalkalibacter krulwichiae]
MKADVHNFLVKHQLIVKGDTVYVAVSGGPDSMALLHYMQQNRNIYGIDVIACHVNHQLRGSESEQDADYVRRFCEEYEIEYIEKRIDVKEYAKKHQVGTQVAARELRYRWFEEVLKNPTDKLVTGHHGDDQVETMLMKMVRGSIPLHTYGIPVKRKLGNGLIIRPLLGITKAKIEQYCIEATINPRRDSSNQSTVYTRNRFRQDVLPLLKKENHNLHLHMQRQNEWAQDDHQMLMDLAKEKLSAIITKKSERNVTISTKAFLSIGVALQRRVIHLILNYLYGKYSPFITSIHIEQVLNMLEREKTSSELHLMNSLIVRRDYDLCHFSLGPLNKMTVQAQILNVPGKVSVGSWELESFVTEQLDLKEDHHQIILDYEEMNEPLVVRTKQPHDYIAARGMVGTKKVGRLFIDRKISKQEREHWPILINAKGEVLWVPLLHRSRIANLNRHTKKVVVISCKRRDG